MPNANEAGTNENSPLLHHGGDAAPGGSNSTASRPTGDASPSPKSRRAPKTDTGSSWPAPAGLPPAGPNDENLTIFRRALGINTNLAADDSPGSVEAGRRSAVGIYGAVVRERRTKSIQNVALSILVYTAHVAQVVLGAVLTALGPSSGSHSLAITALGAANTVVAGVLALLKGQGLPERLARDALEYRRLQDWIEETERLLAMGILGRDRGEVGLLVEMAFKKYNAAKASEENNKPGSYVRQTPEGPQDGGERTEERRIVALRREDEGVPPGHVGRSVDSDHSRSGSSGSGNALVRLNIPNPGSG